MLGTFKINLNGIGVTGEQISLEIDGHLPPAIFAPKLTDQQVEALWLITEGDVVPGEYARSGWWLADKLKMPRSNISSRVTTPMQTLGLICYEHRPTTRRNSRRPNKEEKSWSLKRTSMESIFSTLSWVFLRNNFNDLPWDCETRSNVSERTRTADRRYRILAYLQKRIREYKKSDQSYLDLGLKPPTDHASIAEGEASSLYNTHATFRVVSPLRFVDETRGDKWTDFRSTTERK